MPITPAQPLSILESFASLKRTCIDFVNARKNNLGIEINNFTITIKERNNKYNFYFKITSPRFDFFNNVFYQVTHYPQNRNSNKIFDTTYNIHTITPALQAWSLLVYGHYKYHPDNVKAEEWSEFFFEDLKIHEEEANQNPFEGPQQRVLFTIAEQVAQTLKKVEVQDAKIIEILKDIDTFKKALPTVSKNIIMRRWSKILGKIRLKGKPFFQRITNEALSAFVKFVVEKGMDSLINIGIKLLSHHN